MDQNESEEDDEGGVEEDVQELLNMNYVDGSWDPLRSYAFSVEDKGYLSRIYNNREVFDDPGFVRISLKSWMLFVDKEHFKDFLRDYCVQEGYDLVVKKANNDIYTVECADEICSLRIHASNLIDGHTWGSEIV